MLNAVNNHVFVVAKYNIAVLSHQLYNQILPAQITQFIQMFQFKADNPLQSRLSHRHNPRILQMFAQQHAEIRCGHGTCLILLCQIQQRQ